MNIQIQNEYESYPYLWQTFGIVVTSLVTLTCVNITQSNCMALMGSYGETTHYGAFTPFFNIFNFRINFCVWAHTYVKVTSFFVFQMSYSETFEALSV
jgi:hypothetical protein